MVVVVCLLKRKNKYYIYYLYAKSQKNRNPMLGQLQLMVELHCHKNGNV